MADAATTGAWRQRLASLDALRGFDMFWIMGADALGGVAAAMTEGRSGWGRHLAEQLEHVAWEGFRFYDLIFPLFVFIAGVSLVFSMERVMERSGRGWALCRLLLRASLLYALGVLYYGGVAEGWDQVRWMGVLQRIAIAYLGAGLCYLVLGLRGCIAALVVLLVGYWAAMRFVPVPGIGAGNLAEGKNLANWIDSQWLPGRKWDGDHDPEGLLSNLPAIGTCLLGVLAGGWMRRPEDGRGLGKTAGLLAAGVLLLGLGWGWAWDFPVIKKLWTSSYVLVAGGWSCLLLAAFHWIVDVRGWTTWCRPFIWVGLNPIAVYLSAQLVNYDSLARRMVGGPLQAVLDGWIPQLGGLVVALVGIGLGFALAWGMNRHKVYVRL
jgi:predicted acyltransferase